MKRHMRHARKVIQSTANVFGNWICRLRCLRVGVTRFLSDQTGQDLVEYAIVAALISLAAIAGMRNVATAVSTAFTHSATKFSSYTT
jgi:pilus assembly protein Flp/PilA